MSKSKQSWLMGVAALLAVLFLGIGASDAKAQCGLMDGLDFTGNCCEPGDIQLPDFPELKQNIRYFTWRRCNLGRNKAICADIGRPFPLTAPDGTPAGCGLYSIPFKMRTCGGQMFELFSGVLNGTYSRTWLEDTVPNQQGFETQVWRILINGDLRVSDFIVNNPVGANPHIPQCYRDYDQLVYWAGYIDYRLDCTNGRWTAEWVLDHACDRYHHNSDSGRPAPAAGYHPDFSYNFAGPSTFIPTLDIPFSQGELVQENMRSLVRGPQGGPLMCLRDEPMEGGFIQPVDEFCVCDGNLPQYAFTDYGGGSICGSFFQTNTAGSKLYVQKRVGIFPSGIAGIPDKSVLIKMGDLIYGEGCTGLTTEEYFEGVEIIGGPPAFTWGPAGGFVPLAPDFDDDANSISFSGARIKAIPHISDKIICANVAP